MHKPGRSLIENLFTVRKKSMKKLRIFLAQVVLSAVLIVSVFGNSITSFAEGTALSLCGSAAATPSQAAANRDIYVRIADCKSLTVTEDLVKRTKLKVTAGSAAVLDGIRAEDVGTTVTVLDALTEAVCYGRTGTDPVYEDLAANKDYINEKLKISYGAWGISLSEVYGSADGWFGYYTDRETSCWSLLDDVQGCDDLFLFHYGPKASYAVFDETDYEGDSTDPVRIRVKTAGYDENWNPVFSGAAATVTAKKESTVRTFVCDADGYALLTGLTAGVWRLTASCGTEDAYIVSPYATVTITGSGEDDLNTAYQDMKEYYTEAGCKYDSADQKIPFWNMLAVNAFKQKAQTDAPYGTMDFKSMNVQTISTTVISMISDGVDPAAYSAGGTDLVQYLRHCMGQDGGFVNSGCSYDMAANYVQAYPILALYLCGTDVPQKAADWFSSCQDENGINGYSWGGVFYPDPDSTCWAIMACRLAGITYPNEEKALKTLSDTMKNSGNSNSYACYLDLLAAIGKATDEDAGYMIGTFYDKDRKMFTYNGKANEMATVQCAIALADFMNGGSVYELLSGKYTYKKKAEPSPAVSGSGSTSVPVKPKKTGTWNEPVTDGTWKQEPDGSWSYTTNSGFRSTWGYIYNPYAKDAEKNQWFYFDGSGKMLTGWQVINGKWYYLNPASDGSMGACLLNSTTPDGYTVNENGEWTVNGVVQTVTAQTVSAAAAASAVTGSGTSGEGGSRSEQPKAGSVSVSISANARTDAGRQVRFSGSKTVRLEEGESLSAYDVLEILCAEKGYVIEGSSSYVSAVNGLAEFAAGAMSGWMYSVNGKYPGVTADSFEVRAGDKVRWVYVTNYVDVTE